MDALGDTDLFDAPIGASTAFVFGNEARGLPEEIVAQADARVRVPHPGRAESLNLAAAATVCLFEVVRRGRGSAETLEALVAAAAHDVRSPLTAMKGFGYALGKRWVDMTEEQRDLMLRGIVYDADRMDTIIRQLLDAARVMSGSFEPLPELTDVRELVRQIADQQARDPEHPPVRWVGDDARAFVDAARLRSTILAFTESLVWWGADGPIEVGGSLEDGELHVSASRSVGDGLSSGDVDALFLARRPGAGSGSKIGLYVARQVARAQGGDAWGELRDGRLTFLLRLPASGSPDGGP
jgi:signal transduction histidine kinase